jgi:hypothetical protein
MSDDPHDPSNCGFHYPEELQRDPDPPPSLWLFRWCVVGVAVVVGVLWWL